MGWATFSLDFPMNVFSGRTPTLTSDGSFFASLAANLTVKYFVFMLLPLTFPLQKFIEGEPKKSATKKFFGLL